MTPIDSNSDVASRGPLASEVGWRATGRALWGRVDDWLEAAGERLNPILVKESRQALQSRQFVVTFSMLLICVWGWSLAGVAMLSPGVRYAPGGAFMLGGYFVVLCVPVLLIVPFAAFRSIAAEREDGTFELLSITTLSAWQIVTGKLGSAIIQMMVYFSALAPCIAFTYMLRGIDIPSIAFLLFNTFVTSVMLSSVALAIGTTTRVRHWQVVLSVLLLILLLIITFYWIFGFLMLLSEGDLRGFDNADFLWIQVAVFSFCVSFMGLFVLAAAANISFTADNRSTSLRVALLVQQFLWIGWMVFFWIREEDSAFLYLGAAMGGVFWMFSGACLTGESGHLSARMQRGLPQSFLGRMALTWFQPGPGTGYLFVVTNLLSLVLTFLVVAAVGGGFTNDPHLYVFAPLIAAYVIIYLGVGRWLIVAARRIGRVTMLLAVLIHLLLVTLGIAIPFFVAAKMQGYLDLEYGVGQVTNWAWTITLAADNGMGLHGDVVIFLAAAACAMLCIELIVVAPRTRQARQSAPQRVLEDNAQLRLQRDPRAKRPKSPWDDHDFEDR